MRKKKFIFTSFLILCVNWNGNGKVPNQICDSFECMKLLRHFHKSNFVPISEFVALGHHGIIWHSNDHHLQYNTRVHCYLNWFVSRIVFVLWRTDEQSDTNAPSIDDIICKPINLIDCRIQLTKSDYFDYFLFSHSIKFRSNAIAKWRQHWRHAQNRSERK